MQKLPPQEYKSVQSGLVTEGALSEFRIPIDAVTECINFDFDRIGSATLRKGLTRLGDDLSGNVLGLFEFRDSGSGTNNQIIMVLADKVKYLSAGTWTDKRTVTTGLKSRFTTFLDFVWMVNGTDATAIWDGNTANNFITTGNAASAPIGKFIENFRSRVWIGGNSTYPDRIYFSSLPSAETTPVITWDTNVTTGNWVDISPSDGENITAIKRTKLALLVFKQNHIYRIYSISATDPDPAINVGTYSQESVVETEDGGVYFHHPTGFFRYGDGSVQKLSKPIQDIVDNISATNYSKISGWEDGDHVYWSVGDVTIDGILFSNMVVRYTLSSETWAARSYPTQFLVSSDYNDGTTLYRLVGDNAGNIYKVNVGLDDDGTPISFSLVHRWNNLDGTNSTTKKINKMIFLHDKGAGSNIHYQTENPVLNKWEPLLQLKEVDTGINTANIKGRKIRFRLSGFSKGEPFIYSGFEILDAFTEQITFV